MKKFEEFKSSIIAMMSATWRVFRAIWPKHRGIIITFLVVVIASSLVPFVVSGAEALLINELLANSGQGITGMIVWFLVLIISVSFLRDFLDSLETLTNKRFWMCTTEFFELAMLKKRSEIDVATYENPAFQDLLGKASDRGIYPICNLAERQFWQVRNLAQIIMAVTVFFAFDWRFFLLAALSAIPDFIVQLKYGKISWDIWDQDSQTRRRYSSLRHHFLSGHRVTELRVFQNVAKFFGLVTDMYQTFNKKQRELDSSAFRWSTMSRFISLIFQAITYIWIIWLVTHGFLKIGTMTFLLTSMGRFQGALNGFFRSLANQFEWSRYAGDMFKVLDTEPVIKMPEKPIRIPDTPPLVEFKNVSFAYPDTERLILNDINLKIIPGERLAIVGLNGAGKSTLIKLLMRFYDPTSGSILINGIDLKQLDRDTWWSCIAVLAQNYAEYNFPIREAIALGRSNGRGLLTKVVRSAKAVDAHSFIVGFKNRYNQMIGKEFDDGIALSVGQSQKIALARSVYRDSQLMILDEPTASIDAQAELKIFEQLEATAKDRTQIIISHRFSTVRKSSKICVLEEGIVSEFGTHEELLGTNKTYARLFNIQAEGYK